MKDWNPHIDRLIKIAESIELGKLTILTGSNGSGKSVIRKLLPTRIQEKLGKDSPERLVSSLSFMSRCSLNSMSGINFLRDSEWTSTGDNTVHLLKSIINHDERFIVLDEVELCMGEELQLSIANYINSIKDEVLKKSYGLLVITHSRIVAKTLKEDAFFNIDGIETKEEWLNREIVPTDLDQFEEDCDELFVAIRDRSQKD
jgi:predicted ATPase